MQTKTDPRVLRTRKLITEAFIQIFQTKSFSEISVKDITTEAMINRATFYNHFLDKYDLLEKVVEEKLHLNLGCEKQKTSMSIEETIETVFLSLTRFETSVPSVSGQEEKEAIDAIIKLELVNIFRTKLIEINPQTETRLLDKLANWLTFIVRGISLDWKHSDQDETAGEFIEPLLPFIMRGIETL